MLLKELLINTPVYELVGYKRVDIKGITLDPEKVERDYLYIHIKGETSYSYEDAVKKAVEREVAAICIEKNEKVLPYDVTFIKTYNRNRFLSAVARNFYRNPSQNMKLVGVTGSHGKTTVSWMIKSIMDVAGILGVVVGASRCQFGDGPYYAYQGHLDPLLINRFLYKAVKKGIHWGIIECSYTTIAEEYLRHIWFNSIVYTDLYTCFKNHMVDYHYLEIRKKLLERLKLVNSPIIVNTDDYYASYLQRNNTIGYGIFSDSDVSARDIELSARGSRFKLITPRGSREIVLKVPGIHNVYNALAAVSWGLTEGLELDDISRGIENFKDTSEEPPLSDKERVRVFVSEVCKQEKLTGTYEHLRSKNRGEIVTLLCVGNRCNIEDYKGIGQVIDSYSTHCVMTSDYSSKDFMNIAFAVAQKMNNTIIQHEMDHYKALQKAISLAGVDGCVVVVM